MRIFNEHVKIKITISDAFKYGLIYGVLIGFVVNSAHVNLFQTLTKNNPWVLDLIFVVIVSSIVWMHIRYLKKRYDEHKESIKNQYSTPVVNGTNIVRRLMERKSVQL